MSDNNNEKPVSGGNDTGIENNSANEVSREWRTNEINLNDPVEFLRRYSPEGPWVLTALKKSNGKQYPVTVCCASNEVEKAKIFIEAHDGINNLYFHMGIPKVALPKRMSKDDMAGSTWLWVDLDPRAGEDVNQERSLILSRLTNNLPHEVPLPTAIIDSGRGYWVFWKLKEYCSDNETIESANKALCKMFGGFADSCHSIEHIGRLPGTINLKTQQRATILEWHEDRSYSLSDFPKSNHPVATGDKKMGAARALLDLAELKNWNVPSLVLIVINYGHDPENPSRWPSRSEAVFYVTCQLVQCAVPDEIILGILLNKELGISESIYSTSTGTRIPSPEKYASRQIKQAHQKKAEAQEPYLAELNKKHAVLLQEGGGTSVLSWESSELDYSREIPILQSFSDFRNRYLNKKVQVGISKTGEPIMQSTGKVWLEHPNRREYLGLRFLPGKSQEVSEYLNMWRGFAVEPVEGDWSLLKTHVREVLAAGNEEFAEYILKWSAWAVQHPDDPAEVAIVFQGGRGTGKGTFARAFKRLFGQHGLQVTSPMQLTGRFNAHLRDCCVLFADEAIAPGEKAAESVLKGLITEPELVIEGKGVNAIQTRNRLHIMMASNEDWVVPAGMEERRFAVFEASDCRTGDRAYFDVLNHQIENGGLGAMLHEFLSIPLADWHPRDNVPNNEALQRQKDHTLTPQEQWLLGILQEGYVPAAHIHDQRHTFFSNDNGSVPGLYTVMRKSSPKLREVSDQKLSATLKHWGCLNYHSGAARGWTFPPLMEMRAQWEKGFGKREWDHSISEWGVVKKEGVRTEYF